MHDVARDARMIRMSFSLPRLSCSSFSSCRNALRRPARDGNSVAKNQRAQLAPVQLHLGLTDRFYPIFRRGFHRDRVPFAERGRAGSNRLDRMPRTPIRPQIS